MWVVRIYSQKVQKLIRYKKNNFSRITTFVYYGKKAREKGVKKLGGGWGGGGGVGAVNHNISSNYPNTDSYILGNKQKWKCVKGRA